MQSRAVALAYAIDRPPGGARLAWTCGLIASIGLHAGVVGFSLLSTRTAPGGADTPMLLLELALPNAGLPAAAEAGVETARPAEPASPEPAESPAAAVAEVPPEVAPLPDPPADTPAMATAIVEPVAQPAEAVAPPDAVPTPVPPVDQVVETAPPPKPKPPAAKPLAARPAAGMASRQASGRQLPAGQPVSTSAAGAAAQPGPAAIENVDSGPVTIASPRYRAPPAPPNYPRLAREMGQQGEVLIRALLDRFGNPAEVLVLRSSGFDMLDRAALAAARQWSFEPGRRGTEPVTAWVQIPVRFALQ